MYSANDLKARMLGGDVVFGCWVGGGSPTNAEILGHIGFDFLLLDHEHGIGDTTDIVSELRAIAGTPTPPVVRVPWNDPIYLKRILDAGVQSVMVPSVDTADAARAAIRACYYPPEGTRGYAAGVVRASTYGLEEGYAAKANSNLLTILQIESAGAVDEIEDIVAVEGVDMFFIGVNDLAGSIGRLEQLDHPDVRALVERAETAILGSGKLMGTIPTVGAGYAELVARGYRLIAGPYDVALLRDAGRAALAQYKGLFGPEGELLPDTSAPVPTY